MGCSLIRGDSPEADKSREIDRLLIKEQAKQNNQVKILLLGPGESGKSTVFKQMKILSSAERSLSEEERMNYKQVVYSNCVTQMRVLVLSAAKLNIPLSVKSNYDLANTLLKFAQTPNNNNWSKEIADVIMQLWADSGIQQAYSLRDIEFQLNDSADYFFSNVHRFSQADYIPTNDDVLRVRVRSTGIEEASFLFDRMIFKVVDVGGQRSERRKWIHCFSGVTTILFCASLIGYCQTLREKEKVSRMCEAIDLFSEIVNSHYFSQSAIILFLNKLDLFVDKIKNHPLSKFFPGYEGGEDEEAAQEFVKKRFTEVVANGSKVFTHLTVAVDTKNIEYVINDVRANVLSKILLSLQENL